jgi:hypothetical protein
MSATEWDLMVFTERVALLMACVRNYRNHRQQVDLEGVFRVEEELRPLLEEVRANLPRFG